MSWLADLRTLGRFVRGIGPFLREPLGLEGARRYVEARLRRRERLFLETLRRGVFEYSASPYRLLLREAGVEYGDVEALVRAGGIESALHRLCDAGVWVRLEEVKGRRPIERQGLCYAVRDSDFDNPLVDGEFRGATSGSTAPPRSAVMSFALMEHDAACKRLLYEAAGIVRGPWAIWRAVPPGASGLMNCLERAKMGLATEHWFTPTRPEGLPSAAFLWSAWAGSRWSRRGFPRPEYVSLERPARVARWLAQQTAAGDPAKIDLPASGAVRVCQAALEEGLDIEGTIFRVGGEPFTAAKQNLAAQVGASVFCTWAMAEAGSLAGACTQRTAPDEVHLFSSKTAVISRDIPEASRSALLLTSVAPHTPKLLLNVETGDQAQIASGRCGCSLEGVGFTQRFHTIRSYEKTTAGGMHFLGSDLARLVEETLPSAHGGAATDYQFVEEENAAVVRVRLHVHPRLGAIDEDAIVRTVFRSLGSRSRGDRMMARQWVEGRILQVVRHEPLSTRYGKIPPLWVVRQ